MIEKHSDTDYGIEVEAEDMGGRWMHTGKRYLHHFLGNKKIFGGEIDEDPCVRSVDYKPWFSLCA